MPNQQETPPARPRRSLTKPESRPQSPAWLNGLYAGFFLYLFLCAINVMGHGLKTIGKSTDWLEHLLAQGDNPFIALMGSVLVTSIVQSSSFTTSLIITLVAATGMNGDPILSPGAAVFAIMGANIGTSVTGLIVSLGQVRIRRQFRRAFTAALVHDIFNWLTVAMLFPLEWISSAMYSDGIGLLARFSGWVAKLIGLGEIEKPSSPIKVITKPIVHCVDTVVAWVIPGNTPQTIGVVTAIIGLLLLFASLGMMVKNLRGALLQRIEGLFRRVFFRNDATAYAVGTIATVLVQSSSVTTSMIVPLAGAGAVKLNRVYPFMLGANLGTTVTGVIAATANPVAAAVTVAIAHVTFNLVGTAVWYPLRRVPIGIARWYGKLASRSKRYAFGFLLLVFIVLPVIGLIITEIIQGLLASP